jgi:hypothetical protein
VTPCLRHVELPGPHNPAACAPPLPPDRAKGAMQGASDREEKGTSVARMIRRGVEFVMCSACPKTDNKPH